MNSPSVEKSNIFVCRKNANPRKGIEADAFRNEGQMEVYSQKEPNPRKGIEAQKLNPVTLSPTAASQKEPNPRKGIETG